ncbi:hypothetical protein [Winogradskyella eximia]|uniref:hypothetical protein n=1 Tax=Winogradskyella eximia TaxID=262006 RepID=UPI002492AC58|nr:hypothetical protein [Winogradskyella eximia]
MNADCFTYSSEPYYYTNIFNLIGYSFTELKKEKEVNKYSRKEILEKHIKFKGKSGSKTKLELEDYLRNDLLKNYVDKFRSKFDLEYFHFIGGVDEIYDGVTIGSLDIKVLFPTDNLLLNEEYLAIECKRINKLKKKKRYYIDHGVNRFLTRQYYPESESKIAVMISFMECEEKKHLEDSNSIVSSFNKLLKESYKNNILLEIGEVNIDLDIVTDLDIYNSYFKRIDDSELQIYHVFLDYYNLIEP